MSDPHASSRCAAAWLALRRVHAHVATQLEAELRTTLGLTQSEFDTLLALYLEPETPCPISHLNDAVDLSQPAFSRLLMRLEDRGAVVRSRSDVDARQVMLDLTPEGHDLTLRAINIQAQIVYSCMSTKLDDADQFALLEILNRIMPHQFGPTATHSPAGRTGDHQQTPHP
jgi:DNA-binding MarR family transcriptional regulator